MKEETIKSLLMMQAFIANKTRQLKNNYSGHTLLVSDFQDIEIQADATMKILNQELEESEK